MLTKVLFTAVVIIGVVIYFRAKAQAAQAREDSDVAVNPLTAEPSVSPRTVAYALLGVLVGISALVFAFNWHTSNRIVDIRVISDGTITLYQARHKAIKGRTFTTLAGARVTLGESDRVEMLEP